MVRTWRPSPPLPPPAVRKSLRLPTTAMRFAPSRQRRRFRHRKLDSRLVYKAHSGPAGYRIARPSSVRYTPRSPVTILIVQDPSTTDQVQTCSKCVPQRYSYWSDFPPSPGPRSSGPAELSCVSTHYLLLKTPPPSSSVRFKSDVWIGSFVRKKKN